MSRQIATNVVLHGLVAGPSRVHEGFLRRGQRVEAKRPAGAEHPLWVRAGSSDILTHLTVLRMREWDIPLRARTPKVILDLGANIGLTAIWYAIRYPGARIVSVECEAENYELLVANTKGYPQIETLHAAVWSEPTTITVTDPGEGEWGYQVQEGGSGEEVEALTVDGILDRFGIDEADLVKMDIEGAEAALFAEPSGWIGRVHAIGAELHEKFAPGCTALFERATAAEFPLRAKRGLNVQVERA